MKIIQLQHGKKFATKVVIMAALSVDNERTRLDTLENGPRNYLQQPHQFVQNTLGKRTTERQHKQPLSIRRCLPRIE